MLFNTFVFAGLFLPLTLLVFWSMPSSRAKRLVLLVSSLIFYAYWFPPWVCILIGFVFVAWYCAIQAEKTASAWPVWLAAGILLGGLGYFKYAGFLERVVADLGFVDQQFRIQQLALPLGISFMAFQALGYVIDVHRREFCAEQRLSVVLLFKGVFPQLIAGPICRACELMPQIRGDFIFRADQFFSGLGIFALGLFIKECFADNLAPLVDRLFQAQDNYSFAQAWTASIGFGGQIYADFWGYSTMAVGLARMFSIQIPVNFNLPYSSTSLREFWRRWHITLSQWLRDYLFKPLGGSRYGLTRTALALLTTMLLGGMWHGANYTFIAWGAIHGMALVLEHLFGTYENRSSQPGFSIRGVCGWGYTFVVVFVAWVFFRAPDVHQAIKIVSAMVAPVALGADVLSQEIKQVAFLVATFVVAEIPIEGVLKSLRSESIPPHYAIVISFCAIIGSVVLGAPMAVPFIYFQF